ncbi:MAG: hypothetical protein KGZ63_11295 [Clostridiales bacterium]|jgi:hypothetical protein|nr:hypothetical protein [Clostridiales bacterium]
MKVFSFFLVIIAIIVLITSNLTSDYPASKDDSIGQGVIVNFSVLITDSVRDQLKINKMDVEGNFIWGKNIRVRFVVDENTAISDNHGEVSFNDLKEGQTVKIWIADKHPYILLTGGHTATRVIIQ